MCSIQSIHLDYHPHPLQHRYLCYLHPILVFPHTDCRSLVPLLLFWEVEEVATSCNHPQLFVSSSKQIDWQRVEPEVRDKQ